MFILYIVLPFFISYYLFKHESICRVGGHGHVTVRGLQDYMFVKRIELLTVVSKRTGNVSARRLTFFCIDFAVADSCHVCLFRLECPFDTAVELAAFSLQGKHSRYPGFSPTLFLVIGLTSETADIVCPLYV